MQGKRFWIVFIVLFVCLGIFLVVKFHLIPTNNSHSVSIEQQQVGNLPCGLNRYYPIGSNTLALVPCGYLYSSDNQISDYYLAKVKDIVVKNNNVYLMLDLGKGQETAWLGEKDSDAQVLITQVAGNQLLPYLSNESPVMNWVHLDEKGVATLREYIGRYVLFNAFTGSEATLNQLNDSLANHPEYMDLIQQEMEILQSCGSYEALMRDFYGVNNQSESMQKQALGNGSDCSLYGTGFYVYQ